MRQFVLTSEVRETQYGSEGVICIGEFEVARFDVGYSDGEEMAMFYFVQKLRELLEQ